MLLRLAEDIYIWATMRALRKELGVVRADDERVLRNEIRAVQESILYYINYQSQEASILNERLSRRFDPGMALQEATNRAIEAKKELRQHMTLQMQHGLEEQKQRAKRAIRSA